MTINIIEEWLASPEPSTVAELSLPLTYFDMQWLNFHGIERLLFYKIPHTNNEIIPKLKASLSIALNHYLSLTGNLVYPLEDSGSMPILQYVAGDSVPLTVAESSEDFDCLTGNQPRKCDKFYPLVPELPSPYVTTTSKIVPLLALQITLFPNSGISIGCTSHHAAGDANAIVQFIRAWALIYKFDGDSNRLTNLPFYDRSVIKDPDNLRKKYFDHMIELSSKQPSVSSIIPTNKVRATFTLRISEIQELKNHLFKKRPALIHHHVSSYTVTCAYIWTCWLKTEDAVVGETTDDDDKEAEYFLISMDCRSRLDPPIPAAYFGNCITATYATSTHEELVSSDGFLVASEIIGAAIQKTVNDKEALLSAFSNFSLDVINWRRCVSVAGTPKYNLYDADFGWGRPQKFEFISIDKDKAISLNKSRGEEEESGLEVGLSMPENQMETFASIFTSGLRNL